MKRCAASTTTGCFFVVHAWRFSAVIRDGGAIVDVFVIHPLDSKKILGCHLSLAVGVVVMVEKE